MKENFREGGVVFSGLSSAKPWYKPTVSEYNRQNWLLPLFVLAHFAHHLLTALAVPLLPFIRTEFSLDYTQSGLVISAFTLSYGIAQLPAGWLADHMGPRRLITLGISGVALAGLVVGLSQTYLIMIISLVLMGLLGGGYHPSAPPVISRLVEPKNRGRALGFHLTGGSASFFLAPLIGVAIATTWGWRGSFIGLAVPTIAFGMIFHIILRRRPTMERIERNPSESYGEPSSTPGRLSRLTAFMILSTFTLALVFSAVSFIPLYMVDHFGVRKETGALYVAVIYSAGLWAGPLGGYLSDRLGRVPVLLTMCLISGPVIFLLNLAPYALGIGATLVVIGMAAYIVQPTSEAYIVSQTSDRNRSKMLGLYYFIAMEGGGILTPILGHLIDKLGFYASFTITGAALVAATSICSLWLWGTHE